MDDWDVDIYRRVGGLPNKGETVSLMEQWHCMQKLSVEQFVIAMEWSIQRPGPQEGQP